MSHNDRMTSDWVTSFSIVLTAAFNDVAVSDPRLAPLNGILAKHGLHLAAESILRAQLSNIDDAKTDLKPEQLQRMRDAIENSPTVRRTYDVEDATGKAAFLRAPEKSALMADLNAYADSIEGQDVVCDIQLFGADLAFFGKWRIGPQP